MPAKPAMERARIAAEQSWLRAVGREPAASRRGFSRAVVGFTLAAGLAAVALFFWLPRPDAQAPVLLARIVTMDGAASMRARQGEIPVQVQTPVHSGTTLASGEGRVALIFGDSLSLRVNRHTRLRFESHDRITLLQGVIYVDSGGVNAVPALRVGTPAGEFRHVGTQFQVMVMGNTTHVRVREGRVLLTRAPGTQDNTTDIATGDELSVTGNELAWRRGLPSFGADWEWSATVAPQLEIENRPLAEFIAWMAREHGWQIRYGDDSLQQRTHDIRLHGSLDDLGTDAMLERVSLVTGVPMSVRDGVLWVGGRQ
jgi:ferric-dicitrate binding protein FerR (iron transport regulator)